MVNVNTNISSEDIKEPIPVTVDCVVIGYMNEELYVLITKSEIDPFIGQNSLVGDFIREDENLDDAAKRILLERTAVSDVYLEQVKAFGDVKRHPIGRILTIAYFSLIKLTQEIVENTSTDYSAEWIRLKEINQMAFDHKEIMDFCVNKMKRRFLVAPIGFNLMPKKFTLPEIQKLYEVVLDREFDKRNFRRKLMNMKVLHQLNENQMNVAHRPAKLFSFDESQTNVFDLRSLGVSATEKKR